MTETKSCPKCGTEMPSNAPAGICPACLMQAGLKSDPEDRSAPAMHPTNLTSGFVPPEPGGCRPGGTQTPEFTAIDP